ncbi:uncharacterized protein LOC115230178, partial [Argonauta hians]
MKSIPLLEIFLLFSMVSLISSLSLSDQMIQESLNLCILSYDKMLLWNIHEAQIRTDNGTNGNIFRVTEKILNEVKNKCGKGRCNKLEQVAGKNVESLTLSDLDKPLVSTVVMSYNIRNIGVFPTSELLTQARYWRTKINKGGSTTVYVAAYNSFRTKYYDCSDNPIDIALVQDISKYTRSTIRKLYNKFIMFLILVYPGVRYSVVEASSRPRVVISFDTSRRSYSTKIFSIQSDNRQPNINKALNLTLDNVFNKLSGKTAIKILYFASEKGLVKEAETLQIAKDIKDNGIQLWTYTPKKYPEYNKMASKPSCKHVSPFNDVKDTSFLVRTIVSRYCQTTDTVSIGKEHYILVPANYTNTRRLMFSKDDPTMGVDIDVAVNCGEVMFYVNHNGSYPSAHSFAHKTVANETTKGSLKNVSIFEDTRFALVSRGGDGFRCHYNLSFGLPAPPTTPPPTTTLKPVPNPPGYGGIGSSSSSVAAAVLQCGMVLLVCLLLIGS